jgi:excisionase family DNA binding protein
LKEGDLLTVAEALRLLPVGKSTLYALVRQGDLPAIRITTKGSARGRVLLFRDSVDRLVARLRSGATPIRQAPTIRVDPDSLRRRILRHV